MSLRTVLPAALAAALLATVAAHVAAGAPDDPPPAPAKGKADPKAKADPLPPAPVRLWVKAPTATGLWTMRIDNEGSRPVRVPADVRLLRFDVETYDKPRKTVHCDLPASLRPASFPEKRELLLAPGQSYLESFDPHLFCFGKDAAALVGGNVVRTRFGWDPPSKYARRAAEAPFAADGTDFPPLFQALKQVTAPTLVLSYGETDPTMDDPVLAALDAHPAPPPPPPLAPAASSATPAAGPRGARPPPAAPAPVGPPPKVAATPAAAGAPAALPPPTPAARPPIVDENAPRLDITPGAYSDASSPERVAIEVTATNTGHRPMTVLLRSHMLSFVIEGPDGLARCDAVAPSHAVPRDNFRTLKPGASLSMGVLLSEVCQSNPFHRPGLYRVTPTLHVNESGAELGLSAYTDVVTTDASTLVRVLTAREPFYWGTPAAIPTPRPPPGEGD